MTLKDWKAQHVVGRKIRVIDHWIEKLRGTVRTITKVQGNGYWFKTDGEENAVTMWSPYPKAAQIAHHDDGSFTVDAGQSLRIDQTYSRVYWTLAFAE